MARSHSAHCNSRRSRLSARSKPLSGGLHTLVWPPAPNGLIGSINTIDSTAVNHPVEVRPHPDPPFELGDRHPLVWRRGGYPDGS